MTDERNGLPASECRLAKSLHHSAKLLAHDIMEQDLSPDVFEAAAWTLMSRVLALVGWANSTTCD